MTFLNLTTIQTLIDNYHQSKQERPRPHLGASLLGHDCDRWLWLTFRWAIIEKFDGRILRLFRRGQLEETTVIEDLKAIGCKITDTGAKQSRVDFGSHVSGSIDGIIESGVYQAENKPHILEIKTHGLKSFNDLKKSNVEASKPMHYAQMQVYMHGTGIDRALYYAVCKDNDNIYTERVKYRPKLAKTLINRGHEIALSMSMPEMVENPNCKWCPSQEFCFNGDKSNIETNCRTCAYADPQKDSTFLCHKWDETIPLDAQYNGCNEYIRHGDLC